MRSVYELQVAKATEIERNLLQDNAVACGPCAFGRVCKALWPHKTEYELAARAGCAVRTASYQISGEHPPSARSLQVVLNAIIPAK